MGPGLTLESGEFIPAEELNKMMNAKSKCAQCGKGYNHTTGSVGCPKCAPGVKVDEVEFRQPISAQQPAPSAAAAETLGVYCGIAPDDVTDPTHPRYVAGFKAGHAAGKKRADAAPQPSPTPQADSQPAPACKGENCAAVRGVGHSQECEAEHERSAGGLDTAGNRNPDARYAGYTGQPKSHGYTADQLAAWEEGVAARAPADSVPAVDSPLARRFGGCPSCGRSDCVAMSCARTDPADLLQIAARAPADSVTAPAGWKLVPEEPTDEMLNATYAGQHCSDVYRDMLAASPTPPAQAADSALKDHQIAALVNELRDIAIQYHGTKQLRERIAHAVVPALKARAADSVLEDAARWRAMRKLNWIDSAIAETHGISGGSPETLDAAVDAARKQGANHD